MDAPGVTVLEGLAPKVRGATVGAGVAELTFGVWDVEPPDSNMLSAVEPVAEPKPPELPKQKHEDEPNNEGLGEATLLV